MDRFLLLPADYFSVCFLHAPSPTKRENVFIIAAERDTEIAL